MNDRVVPKMTNFRVVKLSNSPAKAGPMSAASALGLTCVPRLELNGPTLRHFESQHESLRINQRFPSIIKNRFANFHVLCQLVPTGALNLTGIAPPARSAVSR
jgi:hypothetical protein